MVVKHCAGTRSDGSECRTWPLKGERYCLFHSPDHGKEAAEARRLGGLRRRREKTVAAAYELAGLGSVEDIRRVLEIAVLDALGLENSVARVRVLIACAAVATKLLEADELASFRFDVEDG